VNEIACCIQKKENLTKQGNNLLRLGAEQMREGMNCYFAGCDLIRDAEILRLRPETQGEFEILRKKFRKRDTGLEEFNW